MSFVTGRGRSLDQRWVSIKNVGAQEIPAWGMVEITGTITNGSGRVVYQVQRPSADDLTYVAINSFRPVPATEYGRGTFDWPAICLYDNANDPAVGETWGTSADSFKLTKDKKGFLITGSTNLGDDRTFVTIDSASAGNFLYRFTLNEDMGESVANEADADLLELDGTDTTDDVDILDPAGVWSNAIDTAAGYCIKVNAEYYVVGCQLVKPLCAFTLNAALATTDASKAGTITAQYGPGMDNNTAITVHNQRTKAGAGAYIFEGDSGDYGLAMWDSGTNYRIIQLECP